MTCLEKINEMKEVVTLEKQNYKTDYFKAEENLVNTICMYITNAEVTSRAYGIGTITKASGSILSNIIADITFKNGVKRISFLHIMTNNFTNFTGLKDIDAIWSTAFELHTVLTDTYKKFEREAKQLAIELEKKAEADRKAEAKYEELKTKALKDFNNISNRTKVHSDTSDFYYALGWLASHIGTVTATLPDYLGAAFEKYFGTKAPKTLVDSRAKTSGGYAKQWSWEFKCTIKKLKDTVIPSCIQNVTADFSKGIHNTSFIWDLVEDYGFQFGKTQDVEKIAQTIPAKYINSFNEGLTA